MITLEQFKSLEIGDVFYRGNTRHLIEAIEHRTVQPNPNYLAVNEATVRASLRRSIKSGGHIIRERGFIIFLHFRPYNIDKLVKKDRVRSIREYKPRRDYPFETMRRDMTELEKNERNDCSVRALATCLAIPYSDAHEHMCKHGRLNGKGAMVGLAYRTKGFLYTSNTTRFAFGRLVKSGILPERSIVLTKTHAVCVLAGVVHDGNKIGSNTAVLGWYENVNA